MYEFIMKMKEGVHQGKEKDQSGLMPTSVLDLGFSFEKPLHSMQLEDKSG